MSRIVLLWFLACLIQKSFCQVIANSPYYGSTITSNGLGLTTMPVVNSLAASSPVNGMIGNGMVSNGLAIANALPSGSIYSGIPSEAAIGAAAATAIAANAANTAINAGGTGLEGFSLGGLPISGVSPMGYGDVAVAGELPVGGSTAVVGNVPVIGYVTFEGTVPAGGTVTLASNCGCSNPSPVY